MKKNILNVLYSSDDNYAEYMTASICSLIDSNNESFRTINIFIINNNITMSSSDKIEKFINEYSNVNVFWINFKEYEKKLELDMMWDISISSYARLFVSSMIPEDFDRIIYIDCDTIIRKSLYELWNIDLKNNVIGAVQNPVGNRVKNHIGLASNVRYFNAGFMLINLKLWRELNIEEKALSFIENYKGRVYHHDQGVLNGILSNFVMFLPLKYNVMTIQYFMSRDQLLKYFKNEGVYYDNDEYENSKIDPTIIHFTPSFTSRPWFKNCKHPLRNYYWKALKKTPWKDSKPKRDNDNWYVKLINWRYRNFPV